MDKTMIHKTSRRNLRDAHDEGYIDTDPADLMGIMWQMTEDTWAFYRKGDAERRLQRHIEVLTRRKG